MSLVTKILAGNDGRISRLHTARGTLVAPGRLLVSAPRAIVTWIGARLFHRAFEVPWLAYSAVEKIDTLLRRQDRMCEYGAGGSTLWFGRRVATVTAMETAPEWAEIVTARIGRAHLERSVRCVQAELETAYINGPWNEGKTYDVVLVDGFWRLECLRKAMAGVSRTGLIIMDDCDKWPTGGEMRIMEDELRAFVLEQGWILENHVDFSPTSLFVKETMLAYSPARRRT